MVNLTIHPLTCDQSQAPNQNDAERCWFCGGYQWIPVASEGTHPNAKPCPRCVRGIERDEYRVRFSVSSDATGTMRLHPNGRTVLIHDANPEAAYFVDWSLPVAELIDGIAAWLEAIDAYQTQLNVADKAAG